VHALQARRVSHPAPYACPLRSQGLPRGWRRACWHVLPQSRLPGLRTVVGGLVVVSAVLLWYVSTRMLSATLPEGVRPAYTIPQYDTAPIGEGPDSFRHSAARLQEEAAAEPVPEPSILVLQRREIQLDEGDLAREGEPTVRPEALAGWSASLGKGRAIVCSWQVAPIRPVFLHSRRRWTSRHR
jgi:hypothetical protein